MASLHGFISASNFLHSLHLGLTPPHYQILNATAAKHGLVPRQAQAEAGKSPRTWFRRSDIEKLSGEIVEACKAVAKNPSVVGVPHPYKRRPGAKSKAESNRSWPSAQSLSVTKRIAEQRRKVEKAQRKRLKGKPVRRNPLAQHARRDTVLLSVPYGTNKTLLVTMEEGRQIHSGLDSVFSSE